MGFGNNHGYGGGGGMNVGGGPPGGYMQTQPNFMGDNFTPPPVDAFSTPLNGNHGGGGPGIGGGYPPHGMN